MSSAAMRAAWPGIHTASRGARESRASSPHSTPEDWEAGGCSYRWYPKGAGADFCLSGDLCVPVGFPAMAVDEAAEVGHAIYATDSPASTGLFEASADHIFAGTFDLSAANRAAFRKTLGVMQMRNMIPQVVSEALQGFAACRVLGKTRLLEMLVD